MNVKPPKIRLSNDPNPTIETYNKYAGVYDEEVAGFWDSFPPDFVDAFAQQLPGSRVLNLGSGSGRDALLLRGQNLEVVCLDASQAMVAITTQLGFESHLADFSHLNFPALRSLAFGPIRHSSTSPKKKRGALCERSKPY